MYLDVLLLIFMLDSSWAISATIYSEIFLTKNVSTFPQGETINAYFSYSLLLQKGNSGPSVIVGAPKNWNSPKQNGDVYHCNMNANQKPTCIKAPSAILNDDGNLYGAVVDGEDRVGGAFVVCAPRQMTRNIMRGYCVQFQDPSLIQNMSPIHLFSEPQFPPISPVTNKSGFIYNYAFALGGFDMVYFKQNNHPSILIGAPGRMSNKGSMATYSLDTFNQTEVFPKRTAVFDEEIDFYLGYSVAVMKSNKNRNDVWFLAGVPRGNDLKGKAIIYSKNPKSRFGADIEAVFNGEEVSSYFGGVVFASDLTGDDVDDILIAAPFTAGATFDEGAVYFYKGIRGSSSFEPHIKLNDNEKMGGRFGMAISLLGDLDLDGYNDVAISAPFEDDGKGSVYIYRGSATKLDLIQKIDPESFGLTYPIKGFGLGLSRGNDIDSNGHNDVAIGAYLTNTFFLLKCRFLIEIEPTLLLSTNVLLPEVPNFQMTLCIHSKKRSVQLSGDYAKMNVYLDSMDYRLKPETPVSYVSLRYNHTICKHFDIEVGALTSDLYPLEINVTLGLSLTDAAVIGQTYFYRELPYLHGCGSDNICNTSLTLVLQSNMSSMVIGKDKFVSFDVIAKNEGEPSYKTDVLIYMPPGVDLRNSGSCVKNVSINAYACRISDKFDINDFKRNTYVFDIINENQFLKNTTFFAEILSLGTNKKGNKITDTISIPSRSDSKPYINSHVSPDYMQLKENMEPIKYEILQQFLIGKSGPSPLLLDFFISVPVVRHNGTNIFETIKIKEEGNLFNVSCQPYTGVIRFNRTQEKLSIPSDKTIIHSCFSLNECNHFKCVGNYITDSRNMTKIVVETSVHPDLLVEKYKTVFYKKHFIAYVVSMSLEYENKSLVESVPFFCSSNKIVYLPLWMYIAACVLIFVCFITTILCLKQCSCFERKYYKKLQQEKLLLKENDSLICMNEYEELPNVDGE
ncbi:integrin alpha-PS4-like [Rhynchophorus ferrugineus]|uniref:integrin alpha-PS4-like n=1 Tax=Rhynchophorus ferrugineus TaxID=354439 RepID=UPI003FCE4458